MACLPNPYAREYNLRTLLIPLILLCEKYHSSLLEVRDSYRTIWSCGFSTIVGDIMSVPVDDSVIFTLQGIEEIRKEANYPDYRVSIERRYQKKYSYTPDISWGMAIDALRDLSERANKKIH